MQISKKSKLFFSQSELNTVHEIYHSVLCPGTVCGIRLCSFVQIVVGISVYVMTLQITSPTLEDILLLPDIFRQSSSLEVKTLI